MHELLRFRRFIGWPDRQQSGCYTFLSCFTPKFIHSWCRTCVGCSSCASSLSPLHVLRWLDREHLQLQCQEVNHRGETVSNAAPVETQHLLDTDHSMHMYLWDLWSLRLACPCTRSTTWQTKHACATLVWSMFSLGLKFPAYSWRDSLVLWMSSIIERYYSTLQ